LPLAAGKAARCGTQCGNFEGRMNDYAFAVEERSDYLYATVTGPNTPETIVRYSADVRDACLRLGLMRVLVVVDLHGPGLSMLEIYKAVAESSDQAAGIGLRAAYVFLNLEFGAENVHLAEAVAATRGIRARTFRNVAQAESWLRGSTSTDHRAV
jgi:hypothetical protein